MTGAKRPLVLVVDEIPAVIRMLQLELAIQGFDVAGVEVGEETLRAIEERKPAVVLLEVVLPGIKGYKVLEEIKRRSDVPVVFVTTQDNDADKAMAFELGAADFVTKPFDPEDIGLRIGAIVNQKPLTRVLRSGDLTLDLARRLAWRGSRPVTLAMNEWALVFALADRPGAPVTAKELLVSVWGEDYTGEEPYLKVWIDRLRRTLELEPRNPKIVLGDLERGFRLEVESG
jgi:two-component system KDP operon response regulator KdpE